MLEPTNLLLLACALIDGLLGEGEEAAILLVFVAAISLLDALQQRRSRRALAELARPPQAPLFGHATWRLALAGAGRGLGLWLLVQTLPRLQAWLALASLGWAAERLSDRLPSERFTYGFGRSTQLASLANAVLILMATAVVTVEGIRRLMELVPVTTGPVVWAAALGIAVNLFSARLFRTGSGHDLNRRAAMAHLLTDAAVSAAVLVSAWSGVTILRQAMTIALDAVPEGIDLAAVAACLRELPGVLDVHHLHVWGLSTSQSALTAHVVRTAGELHDLDLLHRAKQQLAQLGIVHSTIQLEPPPPQSPHHDQPAG